MENEIIPTPNTSQMTSPSESKYEILSKSDTSKIIALSDTEIGKIPVKSSLVFMDMITNTPIPDWTPKMDMESEIKKLVYANSINDLLVRFIRKDVFENETDMMVLERLYPMQHHSISKEERLLVYEKFEKQMNELHSKGFLHGDIQRPIRRAPLEIIFGNIVLTKNGLRLIDTGFSRIITEEPKDLNEYAKIHSQELRELRNFKDYFLNDLDTNEK